MAASLRLKGEKVDKIRATDNRIKSKKSTIPKSRLGCGDVGIPKETTLGRQMKIYQENKTETHPYVLLGWKNSIPKFLEKVSSHVEATTALRRHPSTTVIFYDNKKLKL